MGKQLVKQWTQSEKEYISENYLQMSDEQLAEYLSERTSKAISSQRKKMGLYRPRKQRIVKHKSNKKITFQDVKALFEDRGYILLSAENDYKNQASKLCYKCKKHLDKGVMQIDYGHLSSGRGCKHCGRERTIKSRISKVTPNDDQKLCEEKGFEYLRTEKIGKYFYIFFICPKHAYLGEQFMRRGNMNRDSVHGCQYCNEFNIPDWYLRQEILNKFKDYEILSECSGLKKPVDIRCTIHNTIFRTTPKALFSCKNGCPECQKDSRTGVQLLPPQEVVARVRNVNPNVEIIDPNSYSGYNSPLKIKCSKCGHTWSPPYASIIVNGAHCPNCDLVISKGEEKIKYFLELNKINYSAQYIIPECHLKKPLPFDFAIFKDDVVCGLIEYQGEQHYYPVDFFGGQDKFKTQILRDNIKKAYCADNHIPLLSIPYYKYAKTEQLVKSFLSQIL